MTDFAVDAAQNFWVVLNHTVFGAAGDFFLNQVILNYCNALYIIFGDNWLPLNTFACLGMYLNIIGYLNIYMDIWGVMDCLKDLRYYYHVVSLNTIYRYVYVCGYHSLPLVILTCIGYLQMQLNIFGYLWIYWTWLSAFKIWCYIILQHICLHYIHLGIISCNSGYVDLCWGIFQCICMSLNIFAHVGCDGMHYK